MNNNTKPISIETKIKAHLNSGKSITPLHAWAEYNTTRLAHYIWKLKGEGMSIRKILQTSVTGKRYAEYSKF
jgi:hypothetical protein